MRVINLREITFLQSENQKFKIILFWVVEAPIPIGKKQFTPVKISLSFLIKHIKNSK